MAFEATVMVWPMLMILSALVPVLMGIVQYRRTR
jgi:hypothetical protein